MLLPRIFAPSRASNPLISSSPSPLIPSARVLDVLRAATASVSSPTFSFVRYASHQSQGRANGAKDGPGKRLGAKKTGGQYVIPGNIIFRQRGTAWFAGENCGMGRDHCIFAKESGYVRYYRDPLQHPKRQYIGVVFDKNDTLPYPPNAPRRRRLNMLAIRRDPEPQLETVGNLQVSEAMGNEVKIEATPRAQLEVKVNKGKDYSSRQANWAIGRVAEKAGVKVVPFVPGDRWAAWRKSRARIQANEEKKRLRGVGKKPAKRKR